MAEPHSLGAPGAIAAMGVGDEEAATSEKAKLEVFDGRDPSLYRQWKRRAQLLLAALPSTISAEKHGPKLMSCTGGEAENLLESLEIEKICSEGGDKLIWIDEKTDRDRSTCFRRISSTSSASYPSDQEKAFGNSQRDLPLDSRNWKSYR